MDSFSERLLNFRQLNKFAKKGQIAFVGSSLMEQFPVNELLNRMDERYIVYNRGIGGDTTAGLLSSMNERIFELSPSKIFINIGTNDINESYSENALIDNYKRILLQIKDKLPQTKIYILSYYPVNNNKNNCKPGEMPIRTNIIINQLNSRLEALAEELGCEYIDVNSILLDADGNLDEKYTLEGVHLLPDAYEIVLNTLVKYL